MKQTLLSHGRRLRGSQKYSSRLRSFTGRKKGAVVSWSRTETIQEMPTAPNEKIPGIKKRDKVFAHMALAFCRW